MDTWEASLESYFTGWRDGYAQALDDVDSVIDEQRDGGWETGDEVSGEGALLSFSPRLRHRRATGPGARETDCAYRGDVLL